MNVKKIESDMVIHCKTKEEAERLIEMTNSKKRFIDYWEGYRENTCYRIKKGKVRCFGSYDTYNDDYFIKEFSDIIITEEEEYDRGLNDAWELAKKIALSTNMVETARIFIAKNICGIENIRLLEECFNLTPREALTKLEAYEKEKEIKVGDVVTDGHSTMLVTGVGGKSGLLFMIGKDGEILTRMNPKNWKKTGKHIDIESILAEIGKEN